MLLCDFSYFKAENDLFASNETENSSLEINNSTAISHNNQADSIKLVKNPQIIEYIVMFWVISFFLEEMKQVINTFLITFWLK
jgi:hypothetical protein